MSKFFLNTIRTASVLIFLAGFPTALAIVYQAPPYYHVIAGIAVGFALLGLFL